MILFTGGSGSLGRAFIKKYSRVVSLTNNEYEHWQFEQDFKVKSFICDVRDFKALKSVILTVRPDFIVHAAALKHLPYGEQYQDEFYLTNVQGSDNVAEIARRENIRAILISTDKAVNPSSYYGQTKLKAEESFLFNGLSVIRYGNFWESRGSVIELWGKQAEKGFIEITDPQMERYYIDQNKAAEFLMDKIEHYVPRVIWTAGEDIMRLISVGDLAKELYPGVPWKIIGNRGNEKVKEVLR